MNSIKHLRKYLKTDIAYNALLEKDELNTVELKVDKQGLEI